MEDQNTNKNSTRGGIVSGVILITIGLGLLLFRYISHPGLFPLFLGIGFLVSGCLTRKVGLIIPGGIITGVGLAITATQYNWLVPQDSTASGGVFLLVFSLGWFAIPLLTHFFTHETQWWAFIPGSIMALIGALILGGEIGLQILRLIGDFWPVALIVVGIAILIGYFRKNR